MSRQCVITGKKPMVGNNVSHAKNRTKRRFLPNLMETGLYSEALDKVIRVKLSAHGLRTVDKKGGIDAFVMSTAKTKLDPSLRPIRAQIEKAKAAEK